MSFELFIRNSREIFAVFVIGIKFLLSPTSPRKGPQYD